MSWGSWRGWDISSIDRIVDSGKATLEQLLDEDELLSEIKSQNKKLVSFIIQDSELNKIVNYVTREFPELPLQTQYKYAYLCCEILCSDIYSLQEALFVDEYYLQSIFQFWAEEKPINNLLANYVNKIISNYLVKRKIDTTHIFRSNTDNLNNLIKHIYNSAAIDILLRIIALDESDTNIIPWLSEQNLIGKVVDLFIADNQETEIYENISHLLSTIIILSHSPLPPLPSSSPSSPPPPEPSLPRHLKLLNDIQQPEILQKLIETVFKEEFTDKLVNGIQIIIELLKKNHSPSFDSTSSFSSLSSPFFNILRSFFPTLRTFLLTPPPGEVRMSYGVLSAGVGIHRMKLLELISALCSTNYRFIIEAVLDADLIFTAVELFFEYPWNNFVHSLVYKIIHTIVETRDSNLILRVVSETQLHEKLARAGNDDTSMLVESNKRKGYMGFVKCMTTLLQINSKFNEPLADLLDSSSNYNDFIEGDYSETLRLECLQLGGASQQTEAVPEEPSDQGTANPSPPIKSEFENIFPFNFSESDIDDEVVDKIVNPEDGDYIGIYFDDSGYGDEFF